MNRDETLRCPVCQARFRMSVVCPRCGADLEPLMVLAVKSCQARSQARKALLAGDYQKALHVASAAQNLLATPAGQRFCLLAAWLAQSPKGERKGEAETSIIPSPPFWARG